MRQNYNVVIIGGGASGMIAAVKAAERGLSVLLLDRNQMLGRKILASGNGRCNLLHYGEHHYYGDTDFAETVLDHCPTETLIRFFNHYGLMLAREPDGRMYPVTYQSSSVVSLFKAALELNHADILLNQAVRSVSRNNSIYMVDTCEGKQFISERLVIACGGCAQKKLGGTDDGYRLLQKLGHSVIPVFPSLVPLVTDPKSISGLSGIRVRCDVSAVCSSDVLYRTTGELLFTEYGISGICVMQCSRFLQRADAYLEINFIRDLFPDQNAFLAELIRRRDLFSERSPVSVLEGLVSDRIAYAVLKQAGIPLRGEKAVTPTDDDLIRIIDKACHYQVRILDTRGMDYAQVTAGGVNCSEFDPCTMESGIVPGLHAAGEVLNVDGDCGGYNLMFAFATGYLAGISC